MLSYSLPAFGTSSPRPAGMTVETCTVDGLERTYRLYLPGRSTRRRAARLRAARLRRQFQPRPLRHERSGRPPRLRRLLPAGRERRPRQNTCWNVGYPFQADMTVDDVSFLCELAGLLQDKYGLSRKNTFCTGMSNGGEMCYLLAYSRPDVFAAVAPVSGLTLEWMYRDCDTPAPIPLFEIHGTEDRTSAWEGDPGKQGRLGRLPARRDRRRLLGRRQPLRARTDRYAGPAAASRGGAPLLRGHRRQESLALRGRRRRPQLGREGYGHLRRDMAFLRPIRRNSPRRPYDDGTGCDAPSRRFWCGIWTTAVNVLKSYDYEKLDSDGRRTLRLHDGRNGGGKRSRRRQTPRPDAHERADGRKTAR